MSGSPQSATPATELATPILHPDISGLDPEGRWENYPSDEARPTHANTSSDSEPHNADGVGIDLNVDMGGEEDVDDVGIESIMERIAARLPQHIDITHVRSLIDQYLPVFGPRDIVDFIARDFLGYPASDSNEGSASGTRKRKRDEEYNEEANEITKRPKPDFITTEETFVECGCCFSDFIAESMAQCLAFHSICQRCLQSYVSTQLGSQNPVLKCIYTSGCNVSFPDSELRRLLSPKLLLLYDKLNQQRELTEAEIEDLEECPFCDWACIIEMDVEEDVLFRCGNKEGGCGVVSCRISFIKEDGCNKMQCPWCKTLSCYVCRQVIDGYEHFDQNDPDDLESSPENNKCPLWDVSVEQRHVEEMRSAYVKAVENLQKNVALLEDDGTEVDQSAADPCITRPPLTPEVPLVQELPNPHIPPHSDHNNAWDVRHAETDVEN
ncbi:hypothetical protein H1R20_g8934, partial [Candolleomyces eurysporus]